MARTLFTVEEFDTKQDTPDCEGTPEVTRHRQYSDWAINKWLDKYVCGFIGCCIIGSWLLLRNNGSGWSELLSMLGIQ